MSYNERAWKYGNTDRAQLAEMGPVMTDAGEISSRRRAERREQARLRGEEAKPTTGYFAAARWRSTWDPVGMMVYDTKQEAIAAAKHHRPCADEWGASPWRVIPEVTGD